MKTLKLALILVLVIVLVAVVAQNTAPVQVRLLWLRGETPAVLLLLLTAAGGFILGLVTALAVRSGKKSTSEPQDGG